ncbi:carboxypeptidase-like regulatory domain-containing protein [Candidatus Dactylopiibacterium carminicum]|uniref:carboxypeptidase-like regulatory domain-containing protein n=1 Tax=Candidatus Dactylopiibacterium carminicum TaxID=857335 RepID=UPI0014828D2A|nr:carboxypeptidase-like regulatory domain-containing protein [Candidatus Dactylopiibacterium carminicum]
MSSIDCSAVAILPLVRGVLRSAADGAAVSGATAHLRAQHGSKTIISSTTTDSSGEYALAALTAGRYVLEITDPRSGADRSLIEQPVLSLDADLELENTLWPIGTAQTLGPGNVTTTAAVAADLVAVIVWGDKRVYATVEPDAAGDWSIEVPPGQYGIMYFAANGRPVIHGPYTITA